MSSSWFLEGLEFPGGFELMKMLNFKNVPEVWVPVRRLCSSLIQSILGEAYQRGEIKRYILSLRTQVSPHDITKRRHVRGTPTFFIQNFSYNPNPPFRPHAPSPPPPTKFPTPAYPRPHHTTRPRPSAPFSPPESGSTSETRFARWFADLRR